MNFGFNHPLYLLPFDHRHSYVGGMFHFSPPLGAEQVAAVADSKRVIYDGFLEAVRDEEECCSPITWPFERDLASSSRDWRGGEGLYERRLDDPMMGDGAPFTREVAFEGRS